MRYSKELLTFTLGEIYEERLKVVNNRQQEPDWDAITMKVRKHFGYGKKKFTHDDVRYIFDNFTVTAYNGIQKKEQPKPVVYRAAHD